MTGSDKVRGRRLGGGGTVDWHLPREVPVSLVYNGKDHAVMLATPADLEDFAVGFSLTEGLVADVASIHSVAVSETSIGLTLDLDVDPKDLRCEALGGRAIEGRSGCGLCGVHDMGDLMSPRKPVAEAAAPEADALIRAFDDLPARQPMKNHNRSVHGAAFCTMDGEILMTREDLGRHNALDKLGGAVLRGNLDPAAGFLLITSRVSVEIVHKASCLGIPTVAGLSAPSSLAFAVAERAGMTLIGRDGPASFVVFPG